MTFASLLLVVLASLIHASWNLLAKRAAAAGPVFVFAYSLIACIAYAPWV
ncbi:MAG: multidrug DMT transporter permease, partial [Alcaligenaceae bacterium]